MESPIKTARLRLHKALRLLLGFAQKSGRRSAFAAVSISPAAPCRWVGGSLAGLLLLLLVSFLGSCGGDKPPTGRLDMPRDSMPVMETYGVAKMISDSGVMKYRIIAEAWLYYDQTKPPRQEFPRGIFLERFDENFKMDLYMQADTAWCFDERLWHFKGNVFIDNRATQTTFRTHEVYWDMLEHRFYSDSYMQIKKPGHMIEGNRFTANEQLTQYELHRSSGYMPMFNDSKPAASGPASTQSDSAPPMRERPIPQKK